MLYSEIYDDGQMEKVCGKILVSSSSVGTPKLFSFRSLSKHLFLLIWKRCVV